MDNQLEALTIIFTEVYYWITVVLMFLIHVGFCMYEVGASRQKNMIHTLMKNTMLIPLVTITFYFFGWWLYFALQNGPGITGGLNSAPWATPWSELMGTHMGGAPVQDSLTADDTMAWAHINGVFWAAFLLFSWTAASIVSGAVIERIRSGAFWILAILIGSFCWIIDAAWGWSADGWMVQKLGYHDAYASGVIHAIAGGFALGVLIHLGARIGKFAPDGTPRNIRPRNPWLVTIGLFLIYTGFWGFYVACNIPILDIGTAAGMEGSFFSTTNIYLAPTSTSAITFNFLMSLSGGMLVGYLISKGDAFWTYSLGLAGVIGASAGNDLYHPIQAMLIGGGAAIVAYKMHYWVEKRFLIDDAVGAVAVHGYAGFYGVVIAGFMLWGYPSSMNPEYAAITPWGQLLGAIIMFVVLGFIPGYVAAGILNRMGRLRVPAAIELAGLDMSENEDARADAQAVSAASRAAAQAQTGGA
ncbi:MAG: Amt family ammonium transporter [Gammaproteobacteria bacterium]|jgi:Amt family ammonium transporter